MASSKRASLCCAIGLVGAASMLGSCSKPAAESGSGLSGLLKSEPPSEFMAACVATVPNWIFAESEGYRVQEFVDVLRSASGAKVSWERSGNGAYILRQRVDDRLTGRVFSRDIQLDPLPLKTNNINCGPGAIMISRVVQDGVELNDQGRGQLAMEIAKNTAWEGRQDRQTAFLKQKAEVASSAPAPTRTQPDSNHQATCDVVVDGHKVMSGACAGKAGPSSIVLTSDHDGCTVDMTVSGGAADTRLSAYRDVCWLDEAAGKEVEGSLNVGRLVQQGACYVGFGSKICP